MSHEGARYRKAEVLTQIREFIEVGSVFKVNTLIRNEELKKVSRSTENYKEATFQLKSGLENQLKLDNLQCYEEAQWEYTENTIGLSIGDVSLIAPKDLTSKTSKSERNKLRLRVGPITKRLVSGAIAGGFSRTVVAPLETIRTHLMVGNGGKKGIVEVFKWILAEQGWKGLYRGNGLNVLRVAPARAIELLTYETVKKFLTPANEADSGLPLPTSLLAGASAGMASCVCTYPLELLKTRLTVQSGEYRGIAHMFFKIVSTEGFGELYRGVIPSVIGIIPFAAANYFAYDTLCTLYRQKTKKHKIGNLETLFIGSIAGVLACSATFPMEVARKQVQLGALTGRVAYKGSIDALSAIYRTQGIGGWYRGLVPSCVQFMPAAGISFMCYEALKQILLDEDNHKK